MEDTPDKKESQSETAEEKYYKRIKGDAMSKHFRGIDVTFKNPIKAGRLFQTRKDTEVLPNG